MDFQTFLRPWVEASEPYYKAMQAEQHESCDKCLPVHYSVVPTNFGWSPDIQNPFLGGFTQATTKNSSTHTKPLNNFIWGPICQALGVILIH